VYQVDFIYKMVVLRWLFDQLMC